MTSIQLKTLKWRNKLLKRRSLVSSLLEILIPSLIIIIIGIHLFNYL